MERKQENKIALSFLKQYNITENDIIQDFQEWCFAKRINYKKPIYFEEVNNYIMYCYYDAFDNIGNIEDIEPIQEAIEQVIYNNFNIDTEEG